MFNKVLVLFLLSTLGAQAQTPSIASRVTAGEPVELVWNKDFIDFGNTIQNVGFILHIEKQDAKTSTLLQEWSKVAKHFAGKIALGVIYQDRATAVGSTLGVRTNASDENYELIASMKETSATVSALAGTEDASFFIEAFSQVIAKLGATEGSKPAPEQGSTAPNTESSNRDWSKIDKEISKINFNKVYRPESDDVLIRLLMKSNEVPVIVDFSGEGWCGPCMRFHPTYEAAAKAFGGKVRFVLVDIRRSGPSIPAIGSSLKQTSYVPEIQLFKAGTTSGSQIEVQFDVQAFIEAISRQTGISAR